MTWASDLPLTSAREPVDPVAPDADAVVGRPALRVLGEVDADRQVERVQSLLLQVVAELLDPRLVLHRPEPVRSARRPLGRVLPVPAVHQVEVLGLGVVRLQVGVVDRPGRRDPAVVAQLAEVLRPQPEQRRAVELGVAADVVVDLRRELVAVLVVPELRRPVPAARRTPRWSPSCPAPAAGSRRVRGAAPACRTEPAGGRASRPPRRCRSRSRRSAGRLPRLHRPAEAVVTDCPPVKGWEAAPSSSRGVGLRAGGQQSTASALTGRAQIHSSGMKAVLAGPSEGHLQDSRRTERRSWALLLFCRCWVGFVFAGRHRDETAHGAHQATTAEVASRSVRRGARSGPHPSSPQALRGLPSWR